MSIFKKKQLMTREEQEIVVSAIKAAEKETSGEIRVFVESKCKYVDAMERAHEIFFNLKMEQTKLRNGIIIYVALKHRQSAILGDEGIYKMTGGPDFWQGILKEMHGFFQKDLIGEGLAHAIKKIGDILSHHFPYDAKTDKNELPDDIVFGN